ncbi:MAG: hypothetical protein KUG68_05575 [Flavobacteriaceae bacterium]|nr:hypothetical protein [Flavobacteriaceae bacterium]
MANQEGIIQIVGTLGGINFYKRKGVAIARKAGGGFTREAIKNKPSMQRVRENSNEFGRCSRVKKEFRLGLLPFLIAVKDGDLHGRMMRLFQQIKVLDTVNTRGSRTVAQGMTTAMGRKLLKDFDFTPQCTLLQMLPGNSQFNWDTYRYVVTDFAIQDVVFPKGATHVGLQMGLLCFDFETLASTLYTSDHFFINKEFTANTFALELTELPTAAGVQIAVLGLQFYQEVEGELYAFNTQHAVGVSTLGVKQGLSS